MADRVGNGSPPSIDHLRLFFVVSSSQKNAPAKKQERMSLEGSAPLSQNPEGNTAVAISDVNDSCIIAQERKARIKAAL